MPVYTFHSESCPLSALAAFCILHILVDRVVSVDCMDVGRTGAAGKLKSQLGSMLTVSRWEYTICPLSTKIIRLQGSPTWKTS